MCYYKKALNSASKPCQLGKTAMTQDCFIYWRRDMKRKGRKLFANVHLLVGYNQGTIEDFQQMADELRKTFPQAKNSDICCGKVHKSSYCVGLSIVTWAAYIPKGEYPGWRQIASGRPEYTW